ncbi:hypothetical protein [Agrobacterium tumefaciens]|uniref:hypothetical protein n=1 Tax=Agrobacterium tumefaciens TaxID=358 RepID=UPI000EF1DF90|nr:hypothetical protein [Agrobacterium tumefaciens]AYM06231.1 hypothetical protein At1D1460_19890 [Agrobacterium tumefaciens]NSZ33062.1 hypothetical protein [Agrobacterium tumefaciens]QLG22642.1 hypothetical protein EML4_10035 [Agrobacterium tumefaciens]UXS86525.1 hypothetical protein FY144_09995 [Agrobacterium tumefaciens]
MAKATIQYRQLKTEGLWEGVELKPMLVDVLRRRGWDQNAKHRILDLDQDQSSVILNKVSAPDSWDGPVFAGQLIHLQQGADVHAVIQSLEEDTSEFVVQSLNVGDRARVLKGALYFAVVGNHVGLIEGAQVRGRTLERYLTALLQRADELEVGQAVILNSKFLSGDGKALDESTEVTVAAKPNYGSSAKPGQEMAGILEREAGQARDRGATVFDVLKTLGWSAEAVDSLKSEVPDDGWIEGFFRVFIKQKRHKKAISRATINEALRNIDASDLGLRGNGSEKNGIVKLSVQRTVSTINQSLLDPEDAIEQIVNALKDWANAGKIDCDFS